MNPQLAELLNYNLDPLVEIIIPVEVIPTAEQTSAQYLEMAEDMKRVVDNKDKEIAKYRREYIELKRAVLESYGLVVYVMDILDKIDMDELLSFDVSLGDLLEVVRGKLEKKIL